MSEDIQKFDPNVAGLNQMVEASKVLVIKDADDKAGYELVHQARMGLKNARVSISIVPLNVSPSVKAASAPATTVVCDEVNAPRS